MKKILVSMLLVSSSIGAFAQGNSRMIDKGTFEELVRDIVLVLMLYIVTNFILSMIRLFLNDRLKRKIVEHDTSEIIVAQLLVNKKSERENSLKLFCALTAIGVGLAIIDCYNLSDIPALMTTIFCLAVGFIVHFFLSSRLQK
ncbi:MAG: hypothetical protein ABJB11_22815 [Ferruginibacter sp.]